jgi:hypothetical protein
MTNDFSFLSSTQASPWPNMQTSLPQPPTGGFFPMPDQGQPGPWGHGGEQRRTMHPWMGQPHSGAPRNEQSTRVLDLNSIIERALQSVLMTGGYRG